LGRASLLYPRAPMDDEVLLQAGRLEFRPFDRKRDAWIAGEVGQLPLVGAERPGDDLVPVQPDPDAAHLRRAVRVERDEVRERVRIDEPAGARRKVHRPKGALWGADGE